MTKETTGLTEAQRRINNKLGSGVLYVDEETSQLRIDFERLGENLGKRVNSPSAHSDLERNATFWFEGLFALRLENLTRADKIGIYMEIITMLPAYGLFRLFFGKDSARK